jgi:predicted transcriptional regulator
MELKASGVTASYYIPEGLKARIDEEARKQDRSASWVVSKALEAYLEAANTPTPIPSPARVRAGEGEIVISHV